MTLLLVCMSIAINVTKHQCSEVLIPEELRVDCTSAHVLLSASRH